jgi:hypothetical protein
MYITLLVPIRDLSRMSVMGIDSAHIPSKLFLHFIELHIGTACAFRGFKGSLPSTIICYPAKFGVIRVQ